MQCFNRTRTLPQCCAQAVVVACASLWLVALVSGCNRDGGGGDSNASTAPPSVMSTVQGVAQKGPFRPGSTVTLKRLDNQGQPTGEQVTGQTAGDLGRFSVTASWDGPTLIEIRGNYFNENTGANSANALTLVAVVDLVANATVTSNVNIFTHLVSARLRTLIGQGSTLEQARNTIRTDLQAGFGLQLADGTSPEQLDLTQGAGPLARDNALLLLVSSGLLARSENERQNTLDLLADDFATNGSGVNVSVIAGALANLDETLAANQTAQLGIADPPNSADLLSASIPSWIPDRDGDGKPDPLDISPLDPNIGGNPLPSFAQLPSSPGFPPVLTMLDGTPVTTAADWSNKRAPELRRLFQHYMYGYLPPPTPARFRLLNDPAVNNDAFGGKAVYKEVAIDVELPDGNPAGTIYLSLYVPKGVVKPAPIFLGLNKCPNHTVTTYPGVTLRGLAEYGWLPDECYLATVASGCNSDAERGCRADRWEVENTINRGYAFASFSTEDLRPDTAAFDGGIHAAFAPFAPGDSQTRWGAIAAWAWGIQRAVDYLETDPDIDKNRIAVVGHSRRGKAILLAGAMDVRIDLVITHQSGTAGTGPSRGAVQPIKTVTDSFPQWFNAFFPAFGGVDTNGNPNAYRLPFDQHSLVALVAPRPLLDGAGLDDPYYDPAAVLGRLQAASAVYQLLGVTGTTGTSYINGDTSAIPANYAGHLLQYRRTTGHVVNLDYWNAFIDFADAEFARAP